MPKTYYRCSKCHEIIPPHIAGMTYCANCYIYDVYKCLHNYWWELAWMTIKDIINNFKGRNK